MACHQNDLSLLHQKIDYLYKHLKYLKFDVNCLKDEHKLVESCSSKPITCKCSTKKKCNKCTRCCCKS